MAPNGRCIPCQCSPIGSLSNICDKQTGQCKCKEGITGHDCSNCPPRHVVTDTGCLNCDDDCTGLLLDDVDFLKSIVQEANLTDVANLPWTRLLYLTKNLNRTVHNMNIFRGRIRFAKDMVNNFTVNFDLETLADLLMLKARDLARQSPSVAIDAQTALGRAQNVKDLIADLWQLILNIIAQLKRFGVDAHDPLGSATERMLEESERILLELRHRDFGPHRGAGDNELKWARFLLEKVRRMLTERNQTGPYTDRLDKLLRLLNEIYELINKKIFPETRQALTTLAPLRPKVRAIYEQIDNSSRNAETANVTLVEARDLLEKIRAELYDTKMKFAALPGLVAQMVNLTEVIEQRRSILARLNPDYEERYVKPCMEHAEALMRRVDELARLFNQTKDMAEFALRAAQVYENIIKAIQEAELAAQQAKKAAEEAYKHVFPDGDESLLEKAIASRKRSEELLRQADELAKRLFKLHEDLLERRRMLEEIDSLLESGRHDLEYIKAALDALPKDLARDLHLMIDRLRSLLSTLERTHGRVDDLAARIDGLRGKLEGLRAATTTGLDGPKDQIEQTLRMIQQAKEGLVRVETKMTVVDRLRSGLDLNLRDLKMKITLARQKAASIRISLGADRENTCIRTYEADIEPSFTNNIVLYYAIKHEHQQDALLLYLGARPSNNGQMSNDFMAVEMKNRKIRFIWSTGKSERIIKHQLPIATNDAQLNKDSKWYKIEVKRFGSVANLTVQRVPDANTQDPFEVSESLQSSDESVAKRMDLDRNSYFYIGGLPPDLMQPSRLIQARSFAGCLYELHLDGKKVGLWNFTSNIGCDACKEGATEPIDPTMYNFNDEFGYGRTSQARGYSPSTYLVSFSFRSFDEDALLFFTANPLTRDYVAIYLKDGKVYYETHFGTGRSASSGSGSGTTLTVVSAEKVNTGGWVQLRAERELDYAVLDLGNGRITEKKLAGGNAAAAAANLDLSRAEVYFGGVTPNFSTAEYPGVVFSSFVGCMNSPQIGTTPINLQRIQSFGIEPGCLNRPIRVASFRGDGFLELDGRPLKEDKVEFSFTFKTTRKSGILLLSTFEGKSRAKEEVSAVLKS